MPILASFFFFSLLLLAAWSDVRTRRIPNLITLSGVVAGLALGFARGGWEGLGGAFLGGAAGFGIFFALYLLRAMGAGDVKLMAAAGTFLGIPQVFSAALFSAVAGGVLMLVIASRAGAVRRVAGNMGKLLAYWAESGGIRKADWLTLDSPDALAVPYGLPIAVGCAVAALFPGFKLFG